MNGLVLGVPQTLNYFERMQNRITKFVTENSQIDESVFVNLMMNTGELVTDMGTVIEGQKAVMSGLIDKLGNLSDAIACLDEMIENNK